MDTQPLTEDEKRMCQQLRDRTRDLKITDNFRIMDFHMIRFLRAREMNMEKAEDMFRKYITWREDHDVDNARDWDVPRDLKDNFRYRLSGVSRDGGLVFCVNIGDWNPLICHGRYEELIKVAYHELENISHISKYYTLKDDRFSKMVAIINLEGLTFAHCSTMEWIRAMITLLKDFESNYPETLQVAFLLNAPWVFSILWSIARPFISTATHERLKFLGGADPEAWRSEILEFVEEDQFPERFGGTVADDYELMAEGDKVIGRRVIIETNDNENEKDFSNRDVKLKPVDSIELD